LKAAEHHAHKLLLLLALCASLLVFLKDLFPVGVIAIRSFDTTHFLAQASKVIQHPGRAGQVKLDSSGEKANDHSVRFGRLRTFKKGLALFPRLGYAELPADTLVAYYLLDMNKGLSLFIDATIDPESRGLQGPLCIVWFGWCLVWIFCHVTSIRHLILPKMLVAYIQPIRQLHEAPHEYAVIFSGRARRYADSHEEELKVMLAHDHHNVTGSIAREPSRGVTCFH
jgi:hypothetical protein